MDGDVAQLGWLRELAQPPRRDADGRRRPRRRRPRPGRPRLGGRGRARRRGRRPGRDARQGARQLRRLRLRQPRGPRPARQHRSAADLLDGPAARRRSQRPRPRSRSPNPSRPGSDGCASNASTLRARARRQRARPRRRRSADHAGRGRRPRRARSRSAGALSTPASTRRRSGRRPSPTGRRGCGSRVLADHEPDELLTPPPRSPMPSGPSPPRATGRSTCRTRSRGRSASSGTAGASKRSRTGTALPTLPRRRRPGRLRRLRDPAGLFVTGTGTEVGKTVVAAVIAAAGGGAGLDCAVFKPAVSGLDEGGEPDHALLARASGSAQTDGRDRPLPLRAAALAAPRGRAGRRGDRPDRLRARGARPPPSADVIVCEGVGGLMVPLTPRLPGPQPRRRPRAAARRSPRAPGLGTINHTLLTIEAAWTAELEVRAVVLTPWPERAGRLEQSNRETIAELTGVEVMTLDRIDLAAPEGWPRLGRSDDPALATNLRPSGPLPSDRLPT